MQLNATATAISPTEITVSWDELPAICQNGNVTVYEIQYEPLQTFGVLVTRFENETAPATTRNLTGLQEYVEYIISVRAYTSVGPGPFSDPDITTTFEDSKIIFSAFMSLSSIIISFTAPRSAPRDVATFVPSSTEILVTWESVEPIDENGVITIYEVEFVPLETFDGQIATNSVNISDLNATLTDLEEYVEYNISVRAYTSVGPGPFSDPVTNRTLEDSKRETFVFIICSSLTTCTGPAEAPQNVSAMALTSTEILVTWEEVPAIDENGVVTMYEVEFVPLEIFDGQIATNSVIISDPSQLNTNLTDLEEYVEYNISVRAYTSEGPGPYSDPVTIRTLENSKRETFVFIICSSLATCTGPAEAPQNVTAMALTSTEILVTWEEVPAIDENGVITMYEVEFVPLETFDGQIATNSVIISDPSQLNTNLTDLEEYVEYNISVRAYTSEGPGPYSDPVTIRTLENSKRETFVFIICSSLATCTGPAEAPQNVSATALTSTEILVTWEEVPAIDENGVITMYEVEFVPLETFDGQIATNSVIISDLNATLTDLEEYVVYNISVRAYTSVGPGPYSDPVTLRTLENSKRETFVFIICSSLTTCTGPAEAPQNVSAMALTSTEILVTWEEVPAIDENGVITMYEVEFVPLETFDGQIAANSVIISDPSQLNTNLTDLEEYVEYNISVRAYTSEGPGPYSDPVTIRTLENSKRGTFVFIICSSLATCTGPAEAPQNVTAMALTSTEILVTWEEVPAIDENGVVTMYEVEFVPLETFDGQIATNSVIISDLNATLTDLEEYVVYNISVRAYTSVGPGPYSDPVTLRTLENSKRETFVFIICSSLTTCTGPAEAPQNVSAMALTSTEILVTWEEVPAIDENGVITMYEVEFVPLETFDGQIAANSVIISDPSQLNTNLTDLEEYVEYNISVRAYTSEGPGPYSDPVTIRTLENSKRETFVFIICSSLATCTGPAEAPQNVTAMALTSTEILVTWEEVPAIDENGVVTMYEVEFVPLETFDGQIATSSVNISDLNATLTDLEEYVEYNISVRAYTSEGPGPYSDPVTIRTLENSKRETFVFIICSSLATCTGPAEAPQNVSAMALTSTEILVTWEEVPAIDENGVITMYEVEFVPLETFDGQIATNSVNISDPSQLNTNLTDLEEYVEYNISVRAYTSEGPGPYSVGMVERTLEDGKETLHTFPSVYFSTLSYRACCSSSECGGKRNFLD